jgi:hypothetical protein
VLLQHAHQVIALGLAQAASAAGVAPAVHLGKAVADVCEVAQAARPDLIGTPPEGNARLDVSADQELI